MINHVLPRMACGCAILLIALADCGCTSMNGWGTTAQSKPTTSSNPSDKETRTYLGQKQPQNKPPSMSELQDRITAAAETDRPKLYAEQLRLGRQYLKSNRLDDAKRAYERALQVKPNDPDCHHGLAVIADNQKQFDAADEHYQAAMKQRPRDANLLSDYGYSQFLRGNDQQAERVLCEALTVTPSHRGAMANLGAIYAKQGRQEDALAMFRRGATEAEAQQFMAQLFPQTHSPGATNDTALAQNSTNAGSRNPPPMPSDDKPDYANMTADQVFQKMQLERLRSQQARQQKDMAEMQPPRRDAFDDAPRSQAPPIGSNPAGSPWVLGSAPNQNSSNTAPSNQMPVVTPSGGNNSQYASNQGYGQNPNGYGPPPSNQAAAQPPASQDAEFWQGAPVANPNPSQSLPAQRNSQTAAVSGNGWNQSQQYAGDTPPLNPPAGRFTPNGLQPGLGADPNVSNAQYSTVTSASAAAAQLAMNVGPGGLFPIGNGDSIAQTGFAAPNGPGSDSRSPGEWASPPQYQNPNPQSRGSFGSRSQTQFGSQSQGSNQNLPSIAPQSISDDWSQFSNSPGASQNAGGSSSWEGNNGASYRGSAPGNGNSGNQMNGATNYNGAWPPNNSKAPAANPFYGNSGNQGNNGSSNSVPMWNQGGSGNGQLPVIGSPTQNSSANTPEQWPYSRGQ